MAAAGRRRQLVGTTRRVPFTFLAHQAPVLPLKLWRPHWFSGAGLVVGSMAPDFDKFIDGADAGRYGHTLRGQFVYCLPLSLAIYWLLVRVAAPALARVGPAMGVLRLRDYAAALAAAPPLRERGLVVVASILIGSASHVAFDGFTHADPRVVALLPALRSRVVPVGSAQYWAPELFQLVARGLGALATAGIMLWIARRRRALAWAGLGPATALPAAAPPAAARRFWAAVAAVALAGAALFVAAHLTLAGSHPGRRLAYSLALRLPLIGFGAVCVVAFAAGRRAVGVPRPPARDDPRAPTSPSSHRP